MLDDEEVVVVDCTGVVVLEEDSALLELEVVDGTLELVEAAPDEDDVVGAEVVEL